jgi:hypothetical protein
MTSETSGIAIDRTLFGNARRHAELLAGMDFHRLIVVAGFMLATDRRPFESFD